METAVVAADPGVLSPGPVLVDIGRAARPIVRRPANRRSGERYAAASRAEMEPLAALAHELRAPLATLRATLELLDEFPALSGDEVRLLVDRLRRSVTWMNGLVDNLATWAALRDGRLRLRREPVSVREWLETTLAVAQPTLDRKGQCVQLTLPEMMPTIEGDALRLGQALLNLLTNAGRYGAWQDQIELDVTVEGDRLCIRVTDHGDGIPAEEQGRIFERYVRGANAEDAAPAGQGLGLHIAHAMVRLHGGALGVESAPGEGASFWFTIPVIPASGACR